MSLLSVLNAMTQYIDSLLLILRFILLMNERASSIVPDGLRVRNLFTLSSDRSLNTSSASPGDSCLKSNRSLINSGKGRKLRASICFLLIYDSIACINKHAPAEKFSPRSKGGMKIKPADIAYRHIQIALKVIQIGLPDFFIAFPGSFCVLTKGPGRSAGVFRFNYISQFMLYGMFYFPVFDIVSIPFPF